MRQVVVVHTTAEPDLDGRNAVNSRPAKLAEAFERLGYEVDLIAGPRSSRKSGLRKYRQNRQLLSNVAFVYSESNYSPLAYSRRAGGIVEMTPFLDRQLIRLFSASGVPIAWFYRDAFWAFLQGVSTRQLLRSSVAGLFHAADLSFFANTADILYVPTRFFAESLPSKLVRRFQLVKELPPGVDSRTQQPVRQDVDEPVLRLVYAGGVKSHYDIGQAIEALSTTSLAFRFDICTPVENWKSLAPSVRDRVEAIATVHHGGRVVAGGLMDEASVGLYVTEPTQYMSVAAPVKLFDYCSHGLAVIATAGTYAAELVSKWGLGWVVDTRPASLVDLLESIARNPNELRDKREKAFRFSQTQTWLHRATQVRDDLLGGDRSR